MKNKILIIVCFLIVLIFMILGFFYLRGNFFDKSEISTSYNTEEVDNVTEDKKETPQLQTKKVVTESNKIQIENKIKLLKIGNFNKIDSLHFATGTVEVSLDEDFAYINLKDDFASADGPDLYVYLSSKQEYKNIGIGGVDTGKTLNIGKLKNLSGSQSYKISKEEFEKYSDSVIIWCKDFGVQFSRANLKQEIPVL